MYGCGGHLGHVTWTVWTFHGGSIWSFTLIGQGVSEEKMFEECERRWTDNGASLYYKLTNEPKGSCELKKKRAYVWICINSIYFCPVNKHCTVYSHLGHVTWTVWTFHGGSIWSFTLIGQGVSEEKMFEECERRWTDNGACLYYKLTNEPKGSCELKKKRAYVWICINSIYFCPVNKHCTVYHYVIEVLTPAAVILIPHKTPPKPLVTNLQDKIFLLVQRTCILLGLCSQAHYHHTNLQDRTFLLVHRILLGLCSQARYHHTNLQDKTFLLVHRILLGLCSQARYYHTNLQDRTFLLVHRILQGLCPQARYHHTNLQDKTFLLVHRILLGLCSQAHYHHTNLQDKTFLLVHRILLGLCSQARYHCTNLQDKTFLLVHRILLGLCSQACYHCTNL